MTPDAARERADRIRDRLVMIVEHRDEVLALIRQARDAGDAESLGYPSWSAYVSGEFGGLLPRLSRDERIPLASQLRALGMSTRAIAPVVGIDERTVRRDLNAANAALPVEVKATDGRTFAPRAPKPAPKPDPEAERRRAAWQPFRALMSSTVEQFIAGADDLIAGHDWTDLDDVHARHGINSRDVVLDRLRALRDATTRVLSAWEDKPNTLRRIK